MYVAAILPSSSAQKNVSKKLMLNKFIKNHGKNLQMKLYRQKSMLLAFL